MYWTKETKKKYLNKDICQWPGTEDERVIAAITGVMPYYKGYRSQFEYSFSDQVWHGKLAGIRDCILFESKTYKGMEDAFREAVDDYLEFCKEYGDEPNKPVADVSEPVFVKARLPGLRQVNTWTSAHTDPHKQINGLIDVNREYVKDE